MKTLITIILCVWVATSRAQNIPVNIDHIAPENVCRGDSVEVCFTIPKPIPPNTQFTVEISFFYFAVGLPVEVTIFTGVLSDLVSTDTLITGEPIYCVKMQTPLLLNAGQWCATGNFASSMRYCIWVNDCQVGIEEVEPDKPQRQYFDLHGNLVIPQPQRLLIEQNGNFRKKVVFIE